MGIEIKLAPRQIPRIDEERKIASARMLVSRLERLSADSYFAHQASGLRGSLLRSLQQVDSLSEINGSGTETQMNELNHLEALVERGFKILALAARAMHRPTPRSIKQ